MRIWFGLCAIALILVVVSRPAATQVDPAGPGFPRDVKLPSGKSQQEEILKADHARDLKDAAQLVELAEQLKQELEKNDRHVLSVSSLKKTEEIEKIAKRIRSRLRRF
ncbi:MAG TPA: hypothetical protein VG672_08350 [Bryobacteraceae bacterium]|nr:hypothetical protein [Bryobacteraceae bacterium]